MSSKLHSDKNRSSLARSSRPSDSWCSISLRRSALCVNIRMPVVRSWTSMQRTVAKPLPQTASPRRSCHPRCADAATAAPLRQCCRCCRPCATAAAPLPDVPLQLLLQLLLLPLPLRRYAAGLCAAAPMCRQRCRHHCAAAPMLPIKGSMVASFSFSGDSKH